MKVFIDTSVLIAACKSKIGASSYILMVCRKGNVDGHISRYVIYEAKKQNALSQAEKNRLNFLLLQCKLNICDEPTTTDVRKFYPYIERKDAPIVAAAVKMAADAILTLNTRDFMKKSLAKYIAPVQVMTPKDCAFILQSE